VTAYKTGLTTATLLIRFTNNNPGASIKVISAQLGMDWGNNYTATGISNSSPLTIGAGLTGSITIPVNPIPATSVASNLVLHAFIPSWSIVKYNITGVSGTQTTDFSNIPEMAVYSSDQADAVAAWQQVSFLGSSSGFGIAFAFRTPQGSSYTSRPPAVYFGTSTAHERQLHRCKDELPERKQSLEPGHLGGE